MLAVVDLIRNSHVVKGADIGWLDTTGSWDAVTSQLEGCNFSWVPQGSGWEEEPGKAHEANVSQENLPGGGPDLGCDGLGDTVSTSLRNGDSPSSRVGLLTLNIAKEKSFGDTVQKVHDVRVGPGLWSVDGKADLVHGSSLEASSGAHWGEQFVPGLINQALLELRRLTDLPPQLLSLFFVAEAESFTSANGRNLNGSHCRQGHVARMATDVRALSTRGDTRGLMAQDNNSLDLLQL